jgi:hypothetical protein
MAELRKAPTDKIGVPLAIIPSEDFPYIDRNSEQFTGHHEFFLRGTARFRKTGAQACRAARVLGVEANLHNKGPLKFHGFYDVSDVPPGEQDQANILVMTLAGYIPKQGIDFWSGEPRLRDLKEEERDILCEIDPEEELSFKNLRTDRHIAVGFLKKFALEQSPINIDPAILEKFTSSTKIGLTREAGHEVLHSAIQGLVEPVGEYYNEMRAEGLLHPEAPISAEELVLKAFGSQGRREQLLHPLRQKLILKSAAAAA